MSSRFNLPEPQELVPYVKMFNEVEQRLRANSWFADGWVTNMWYDHNSHQVKLDLFREHWSPLRIRFRARLAQRDLIKRRVNLSLRGKFSWAYWGIDFKEYQRLHDEFEQFKAREFFDVVNLWPSYHIKTMTDSRLIYGSVPFNDESLVDTLEHELLRMHALSAAIDSWLARIGRVPIPKKTRRTPRKSA